MKLVLDASVAESLVFGLVDGKQCAARVYAGKRAQADLVGSIDSFLRSCRTSFERITSIVVVIGPGRFSGLRLSAVFANTMRWTQKVTLYAARGPIPATGTPTERVWIIVKNARHIPSIRPWYGKPPSITKSKKNKGI